MVFVFGTICLDRVLHIPYLPKPGGYVEIVSEKVLLGGEASNTANALREWGCEVTLFGNGMGSSAEALTLADLLAEHGLTPVPADPSQTPTPLCDILITPDGERTMLGRGFASIPPPYELDQLPLQKGALFTADPNLGAYARDVVRRAGEAGMRLYLLDFFQKSDPVSPGSIWQSSTDWVGRRNDDEHNLAVVEAWTARHGCTSILTDGAHGFAYCAPGAEARWYQPFPSPKVVDTTGAGDLFRAGVLHGLDRGWEMGRALAFGASAGALKCAYQGATSRVPSVEEIHIHQSRHPEVMGAYMAGSA